MRQQIREWYWTWRHWTELVAAVPAPAAPHVPETGHPGGRSGTIDDDPADAGMTTVEYAVGTVVAAAFAAVLYRIVTGQSIVTGLTNLVNSALAAP